MKHHVYILLLFTFISAQDKWTMSADLMEGDEINNVKIQRLKHNVKFIKNNKILLTDYAIQYIKDDIIHLNGNTKMINNLDTLTCDSMIYWSKIDSIYAKGNIKYVNANNKGILGQEMELQYTDNLINRLRVINEAFIYNDLKCKINSNGTFLNFRDEMSSKEMLAFFKDDYLSKIHMYNMAQTSYHVLDDSLLAGKNIASGDTIIINFDNGNINRIQVYGGALGKFNPEKNNTRIDTTILYGGEFVDYHIEQQLTYLTKNAFVEYENTRLKSGKILANWETNIMEANLFENQYPLIETDGENPMMGVNMVFDLIAKHGRIQHGKTSYDNGYYIGEEVFRDDPNIFHIQESKFTSCELDNPHFYLKSKKMKLLPKDKFFAKPLTLHIYDIPIFGLPMAVFPHKKSDRQSGWIMPSFDSYNNKGTGFRNLGYYWAPNNYMDQKILIDFFDQEKIYIRSLFNYKKRNGGKWYDFSYNGNLNYSIERRLIESDEIINLTKNNYKQIQKINWAHRQEFNPTNYFKINYKYTSDKKAYQDEQEVSLQNRLNQTIINNFYYSKSWPNINSSFNFGVTDEQFLSVENNPVIGKNLYRDIQGPNLSFSVNTFNIFGSGDNWYNLITTNYSFGTDHNNGWIKYYIDKDSTNSISKMISRKKPSFYHNSTISLPLKNIWGWLDFNSNLVLNEYWVFSFRDKVDIDNSLVSIERNGFKRRLTWKYYFTAKTNIYGLFPIEIGKLNAIRHSITPSITYQYSPDFSDSKFGYIQQFSKDNSTLDYFEDYNKTPNNKMSSYNFKIDNTLQLKILNHKGTYHKASILRINSQFNYNPLLNSEQLTTLNTDIYINNFSSKNLFYINTKHDFYSKHKRELINILSGELPRLLSISIRTNMKLNLFGLLLNDINSNKTLDNKEIISNQNQNNTKTENKLWETNLNFDYNSSWKESNQTWIYDFNVITDNKINLSKKWTISHNAYFNIKKRELVYHSFKIYRPLHCWELSFDYWPMGGSAGFSLKINVKSPDLQDIKLTSTDNRR